MEEGKYLNCKIPQQLIYCNLSPEFSEKIKGKKKVRGNAWKNSDGVSSIFTVALGKIQAQ